MAERSFGRHSRKRNAYPFNFAKVDFIDSYGVGDIIAAHAALQKKGGMLKFVHLSDKIWLIFNYSGLTKIFELFDNEELALKSFD